MSTRRVNKRVVELKQALGFKDGTYMLVYGDQTNIMKKTFIKFSQGMVNLTRAYNNENILR